MTRAENNVSEPPNLKFSGGILPDSPTGLVLSAPAIMHPSPPRYKRPSYGPAFLLTSVSTLPLRI